jgi:cytochrome c peroxidase
MKGRAYTAMIIVLLMVAAGSCRKPEPDPPGPPPPVQPPVDPPVDPPFDPTPYPLQIPPHMPPMIIPADNPLTVEGVKLGRHLFYEMRLSGNNTMSCASCHMPQHSFSDPAQFSTGIDGIQGTRNSMPLVNLGWETRFFWDGRAMSLEQQILEPVSNPIEMHETWPNAMGKLQDDPAYVALFQQAFGSTDIDSLNVAKAVAQFLRTMISGTSKFDKFIQGEVQLTLDEQEGFLLTQLEGGAIGNGLGGQGGADCFHCHPHGGARFTDGQLRNNGLDATFTDPGLGGVTGLPQDMGKFKTPSLRNVALTAPYMHDGRFQTLEEVIDHYDSGGQPSPTIDPNMKFQQGGLQLTPLKKQQLIAFLHTLTDMDFVNDPKFHDPGPP